MNSVAILFNFRADFPLQAQVLWESPGNLIEATFIASLASGRRDLHCLVPENAVLIGESQRWSDQPEGGCDGCRQKTTLPRATGKLTSL